MIWIEYSSWRVLQEFCIVIMGVLTNTLIFFLMSLTSYLSIKCFWRFPAILSKIIAWYGIATILDWVLIAIVDCILRNWDNGDLFKMYNYYLKWDNSGTVGIVLTVLIYLFVTFFNLSLFYFYLVFVHMNGWVIDLYYRLSGDINSFFLPKDDEVSLNYLKWVCHKAIKRNQWVTNELEDVLDEKGRTWKVNLIHIYQFEKEKDEDEGVYFYTGWMLKYRAFLRDYDGSIREIITEKSIISDEMREKITGESINDAL